MSEPLTVPSLAACVDLSVSRFAHVFRRNTGMPPARFLHELRMEKARTLLESTTLRVQEVMTLIGCRDGSHFARHYRRRHGVSPRESRAGRNGSGIDTALRAPIAIRQGDSNSPASANTRYGDEA